MLAIAKLRCKVIGHDIRPGDLACRRCKRDACELVGHDVYTISRKQKMQVCRRCKEHGWFEGATTAILALLVVAAAALASSPRAARAQTNPPAPAGAEYVGFQPVRGVFSGRLYVWNGSSWVAMTQPGGSSSSGAASLSTNYQWSPSGSAWVRVVGDETLGTKVQGPLTDAQIRASALPVTASAGANLNTSALALDSTVAKDATLTGGTQKAIARGGAKGATTAADVTSTAQGADHQAVDVQLYSGGVAKDPTATRALTSADVVTAAQGTAAATAAAWPTKITDGTNVAAVKAASTAAAAADPSVVVGLSPNSPLPAGANAIGTVAAPALTKGTQGANGFSVQELKDAGRSAVYLQIDNIAAVASEALISYGGWKGGAALTPGTGAYVVAANKTFRATSMTVTGTGSAASTQRCRFRALLTTVLVGSPAYLGTGIVIPAASSGGTSTVEAVDGIEIPTGFQIGISCLGATTNTYSVFITGFEY